MPAAITITVPGKPYAQKRAQAALCKARGRAVTYDHKDNRSFRQLVQVIAAPHFPVPFEGPVKVTITAVFEPAPSWSKKKRAAALKARWHTQKPDFDNLEKAACDALSRIAWADDKQIASSACTKLWGERAHTIITVEALT